MSRQDRAPEDSTATIQAHPTTLNELRTSNEPARPLRRTESNNLDALRATAVLCVCVGHFAASAGLALPGNWGFFGVVLFFVHTSLVLMQSLERLETTGLVKRWPLALAFMIRRIFRIYPLSVLFVLAVVIFHIPHFPGDVYAWPGWRTFLSNLAIVQNLTKSRALLAPLWTLPVEVQMYGMLPFLYFGVRNGRFRSLFFWVISVVAALVVPTIFLGRLNIILYAPCFLAGIVAYELTKTCRKRLPAWLWPVVLALAVAAWQPVSRMDFKIEVRLGWIFALAVGFLVPQFREITAPALAKPAHWIAKYSYGLYLSHVVVYWFAIDVMRHDSLAARIAAGVAGIVLLPVAVFHLVEEPFILLGAKYASRIRDFSVKLGARTNRGLRSTRPVVP